MEEAPVEAVGPNYKYLLKGALAGAALLIFYILVMSLTGGSWSATWSQFEALWWLMIPLATGFGIQVGMYAKLKQAVRIKRKGVLVAGGSTAAAGMVACCAHHMADVLPFLGLAGVSIFLVQYQIPILLLSLAINIIGIAIMRKHLKMLTYENGS